MENKDNTENKPRTIVFINSLGQEVTMTYNPALDNLPTPKWALKKLEEANRRLKLKPPPDFLLNRRPKAD
jgi:hypothetical protein